MGRGDLSEAEWELIGITVRITGLRDYGDTLYYGRLRDYDYGDRFDYGDDYAIPVTLY